MIRYLIVGAAACEAGDTPPSALPAEGFVWIDAHHGAGRGWIDEVRRLTGATIFDDHVRDSENAQHPSFFDATHAYEMIIFRGLAFRPEFDLDEPIRISTRPTVIFVLPGCLVTLRAPDSRTVPLIRERLLAAAAQRQRLPTRPEDLMLRLLNAMVDRYLELRQPMTAQLERWQRALLDPKRPFSDWTTLLDARSELRKLENLCEEQLDAMQEWRDARLERVEAPEPGPRGATVPALLAPDPSDAARESPRSEHHPLGGLNDALRVRATDVVEHIERVLTHVRRLDGSIESAVQLHFSAVAHRTSEIMRVLTVLTAVFMPLTLITGIFGMNFETIPGLHSGGGFWMTLGLMLAIAIALLAWFRRRRYLESTSGRRRRRRRAAQSPDSAQTQST